MDGLFLGIDTSNYKTSTALVARSGDIIFERSEFLEVPEGSRGLRQSEAFFKHSGRLPEHISELFRTARLSGDGGRCVCAVGVSDRPRRTEGSYMPCFLAGVNTAVEIGAALGIPVFRFSHQEGHAAAVFGNSDPDNDTLTASHRDKCIFMHLSGGTTEFLICEPDEHGYRTEIIGGTKDISFGQLLDRTGVALGFPFPSGRYLDDIAYDMLYEAGSGPHDFRDPLPGVFPRVRYDGGYFNLSGAETKILRYLEQHSGNRALTEAVIAEMFSEIAKLLVTSASRLSEEYGIGSVYMAGGVASSRTVRRLVGDHFPGPAAQTPGDNGTHPEIRFGKPELSGDNAVGTALLACRSYHGISRGRGAATSREQENETGNSITGK